MSSILVVDDDGAAAEIYVSLLRIFGYEAAFVTNGLDALRRVGSVLPDLIILDMMMPDMNGLDVLRKIKADEQTTHLPVVVFSALDDEEWRQRAVTAGACDYWIKGGFDFGELQEKVASCLKGPAIYEPRGSP